MNLDWIFSPLAQLGALAAGLIACLTLFISTKCELSRLQRRYASAVPPAPVDSTPLSEEIERLHQAVRALEQTPPSATAGNINLTRRTQVLRMHHRDEPVETIAAALQVPVREIELMLKLHHLSETGGRRVD